jgi:hypothetical protein
MSPTKLVSFAQGDSVVRMANLKGVEYSAFELALNDGTFAGVLDGLKNGTVGLTAPPGARIHTLHIKYQQNHPWKEVVTAAGSDTAFDSNVWGADGLYLPTGNETVEEDIILLNYSSGGSWDRARGWAEGTKLISTDPREVFVIGEQHPELGKVLFEGPMFVVATTECFLARHRQACYVWWVGKRRGVEMARLARFSETVCWFAFRIPQQSPPG